MTVRIAINGFGRIGRLVLRALHESGRKDVEVVAINDLGPVKTSAHLLKHDSVHGTLRADISTGDDWMDLGAGRIKVTAERDPAKLPWGAMGIDIVAECTGIFTARDKAALHLAAGAKRVLVSAPADGADLTVEEGDDLLMVTSGGQMIRTPVAQIRIVGRASQGVTVFRTAEGEKVVSVERLADSGGDDEGEEAV